jgi:hypothetical protein
MTIQFYTAGATISMAPMIEVAGIENDEANRLSFNNERVMRQKVKPSRCQPK